MRLQGGCLSKLWYNHMLDYVAINQDVLEGYLMTEEYAHDIVSEKSRLQQVITL